ncbi:MAG: PAS domain-containing protein [Rhodospirillaceae bacterium]|nr:PAS domain-containing protein [Rhodospirillaceae bacterium]
MGYWLRIRGDRDLPGRRDLDPVEIPELLAHVVLMDVATDPLDFRYRLVGTMVDFHLHRPLTGAWVSQVPHQRAGSVFWATMESVVRERRPVVSNIPYVGPHKDFTSIEDLIMPLSADGQTVDMLFITVAFYNRTTGLADRS